MRYFMNRDPLLPQSEIERYIDTEIQLIINKYILEIHFQF